MAVKFVLDHEGGLSENPNDSGGITNYGISFRFLKEVPDERLRKYGIFESVTPQTIKDLTIDQAKLIYKGEFWEGNRFEEINSQSLVNYIFDMAVAHGIAAAVKLLQRSTWAATFTRFYIRDDGVMGSRTIEAVNHLGDQLMPILVATRASYYRLIVEKRPKEAPNLDGWLNRCYAAF